MLFAAAGLLGALTACSGRDESVRLVLITLDTLRWDSVFPPRSPQGDGFNPSESASAMPVLSRWARDATVFDRFYAATASTQPSHASMFTGLHPWEHGVSKNGLVLADRHRTVAERLREAGFSTSAVVASIPVSQRFGFAQGFEGWDDAFTHGEIRGEWLEVVRGMSDPARSEADAESPFYSLADSVTDKALRHLDNSAGRRQFFWFHYFDPHSPYGDAVGDTMVNPAKLLGIAARGDDPTAAVEEARRLYDADVAFLDQALGRLLERLEQDAGELGTHVLIVADHGESFGERESVAHGRRMIPSQLHVPCILRSPRLEPGVRHDVVGSIDVAATLLALAGIDGEPDRPLGGRDLTRSPRRPSLALGMRRTYDKPYRDRRLDGSVHTIDGLMFFLVNEEGELFRGDRTELVRLPGERAVTESEDRDLRRLFGRFEEQLQRNAAEAVDDPDAEEALRSLGYVG